MKKAWFKLISFTKNVEKWKMHRKNHIKSWLSLVVKKLLNINDGYRDIIVITSPFPKLKWFDILDVNIKVIWYLLKDLLDQILRTDNGFRLNLVLSLGLGLSLGNCHFIISRFNNILKYFPLTQIVPKPIWSHNHISIMLFQVINLNIRLAT
jgi:hypothetical protein